MGIGAKIVITSAIVFSLCFVVAWIDIRCREGKKPIPWEGPMIFSLAGIIIGLLLVIWG